MKSQWGMVFFFWLKEDLLYTFLCQKPIKLIKAIKRLFVVGTMRLMHKVLVLWAKLLAEERAWHRLDRFLMHCFYWSHITCNFFHSWCLSDLPRVIPPHPASQCGPQPLGWLLTNDRAPGCCMRLRLKPLPSQPNARRGMIRDGFPLSFSSRACQTLFQKMSHVAVHISN